MLGIILSALVGCWPAPHRDQTVSSANGRFSLDVTAAALTLREGRQVRWSSKGGCESAGFHVADDGTWVAAILEPVRDLDGTTVVLFDAAGQPRRIALLASLDEEERQWLPESTCGFAWASRVRLTGDRRLDIDIPQGGFRPTATHMPRLTMSLDARTGAITPLARPSIPELIEAVAAAEPWADQLLQSKARLAKHRGDPSLCRYFDSQRAKRGSRRVEAIRALGDARCSKELAQSQEPSGDESDLELLVQLERTDEGKAIDFAIEVLRRRVEVPLLRGRAAGVVIARSPTLRLEAARLALDDADADTVQSAANALAELEPTPEVFSLLLEAAAKPKEVAEAAGDAAKGHLLGEGASPRRDLFLAAAQRGALRRWPGALVILGGLREVQGRRTDAKRLYEEGSFGLAAEKPKVRDWSDRELWCEAVLRLAQVAADEGDAARSVALAQAVLAEVSEQMVSVAAPAPVRYAKPAPWSRSAKAVAEEIVRAHGAPVSSPADPEVQRRGIDAQLKAVRGVDRRLQRELRELLENKQ